MVSMYQMVVSLPFYSESEILSLIYLDTLSLCLLDFNNSDHDRIVVIEIVINCRYISFPCAR